MPEKIVNIAGRDVRFKATGGCAYRYKAQFGREFIADAVSMQKAFGECQTKEKVKCKRKDGKIEYKEVTEYDVTKLNLDLMYNMLWVYAKTAEPSIPPPQEWLDEFDEFPVFDIWSELEEIMRANVEVDTKNAAAAENQKQKNT